MKFEKSRGRSINALEHIESLTEEVVQDEEKSERRAVAYKLKKTYNNWQTQTVIIKKTEK